jgi:hypothetical protein
MATIKKVKKAQSGYSATANRVDSLRAVGAKQLGTPEGEKTLKRLKVAEAQEKREDAMKPKKKKMKMGGSVKKAQYGTGMQNSGAGTMTKTKSPGGSYVTKVTKDAKGNVIKSVERRTLKGLLSGAPKAKGVMTKAFKKGGKMSKGKKC